MYLKLIFSPKEYQFETPFLVLPLRSHQVTVGESSGTEEGPGLFITSEPLDPALSEAIALDL